MPRILISLTLSAFFLLACGDSPIAPTNQPTMKPSGRSDWDNSWCGGDVSYQIAGTWRAANSSLPGYEYSHHLNLSYDPQEQCEFYWSHTLTDSGEKVHGRSRGTFIVIDARETGDLIVLTIEGRRSYYFHKDLLGFDIERNDWEIVGLNKVTLWRDQQTDLLHFASYFYNANTRLNPTFSRVVEDD